MKIKTIASIFKRRKWVDVYTDSRGEQWISNGAAVYSLQGFPRVTISENLLRMFDVAPASDNDWHCAISDIAHIIDLSDSVKKEIEIKPLIIGIDWYGVKYMVFPDERKIYTVNEEYFKPLLDEPALTYWKREPEFGGFVLAVKSAYQLKAIIYPTHLHTDERFTSSISNIASLYRTMTLYSAAGQVLND